MKRSALLAAALALVLGAQSLRVFLPALILYIGEGPVNAAVFALFAYAPFVLALAGPLLVRGLGARGAWWLAGGGLIVFRIAEQLSTSNLGDLLTALAATTCFLWLLPLLFVQARAGGAAGWQALALGLLLGLSLDAALRGLTGTLDLSWIHGPGALLALAALLALFAWAGRQAARPAAAFAAGAGSAWPWLGLGLLLYAEWQILQNQGYLATLTGWPAGLAFAGLMLANAAALLAATYAPAILRRRLGSAWPLLPGLGLVLALALAQAPGWPFALVLLVGVVCGGLLLVGLSAEAAAVPGSPPPAPARNFALFLPVWLGLLLFISLVFFYYMSFVVRLPPLPRSELAPLAAAGLTFCALAAARRRAAAPFPTPEATPARLGALLLLAPLAVLAGGRLRPPAPAPAGGYPVRVMTYNIRSGYGEDGRQDIAGLAQAITGSGADVVAFQELSRGWLVSGATDDLALLAEQTHLPYLATGASTDPIFGDGLISRYPILASGSGVLPRFGTLIPRGYVWALLNLGAGQKVLVLTTHLEPAGGDEVRVAQAQALLSAWGGQPQTILLGDMNSTAGSPQMQVLLEAGFRDAWAEGGHGARPEVDWIFHTPDLALQNVSTIDSPASDHFAVVASFAPAP